MIATSVRGEAVTRSAIHCRPDARGYRDVDAIWSPRRTSRRSTASRRPAPRWRIARVPAPVDGEHRRRRPGREWANDIAIYVLLVRASRHGRIMSVGDSPDWRSAIAAQAAAGRAGRRGSRLRDVLVTLRDEAGDADVIVTEAHLSPPWSTRRRIRRLRRPRGTRVLPGQGRACRAGTSEPDESRASVSSIRKACC